MNLDTTRKLCFRRRIGRAFAALALLGLAHAAGAQWPLGLGTANEDEVVVSRVASNGDIFIAGHFSGTLETPAGTISSIGLQDVFVARVSQAGTLKWIRSAGGGLTDTVGDLALDSGDNAYIVGSFFNTALFGGSDVTAASELDDGYLARINADGNWVWVRRMGGTGRDAANAVATLPGDITQIPPVAESVVVGGQYQCRASFDDPDSDPIPDLDNGNCPAGRDLFIARYTVNGEGVWALDRGAASSATESVQQLEIDADGRAWILGQFVEGGSEVMLSENFDNRTLSWSSSNSSFGAITETDTAAANLTFSAGAFKDILLVADPQKFFTGTPALALRAGEVNVDSPTQAVANSQRLRVSFEAMSGMNMQSRFTQAGTFTIDWIFSDEPDQGEDLIVQYLDSNNQWQTLHTIPGGSSGQRFDFTGSSALAIEDPNAFHDGFRLRFRLPSGGGPQTRKVGDTTFDGFADWWHIDNVVIERVGQSRPFLMSVGNLRSDSPSMGGVLALDRNLRLNTLKTAPGNRLLMGGLRAGTAVLGTCGNLDGSGAFVAAFATSGAGASCTWVRTAGGGEVDDVTADANGDVYATGRFVDQIVFDEETSLSTNAAGASDIFIARYRADGSRLEWATGGGVLNDNEADPDFGVPAFAGGTEDDRGLAIATDGFATLYVGGSFRSLASFGPVDSLAAAGGSDGVLFNLGLDGRFFQEEGWIAGEPLTPPPNAAINDVALRPDFLVNGEPFGAIEAEIFSWSKAQGETARLIPLQAFGAIEVRWRIAGEPAESKARVSSQGSITWPGEPCSETVTRECFQVHVVGAPVQAEPPSGNFRVFRVISPQSSSSLPSQSGGTFTTERTGFSSIIYVNGPSLDELQHPTVVEIVATLPYTGVPLFVDDVEVEIGQPIRDPFHNEPNRNGFVVNANAFYDGHGADAAYNRTSRQGPIIPVNRYSSARPQEQGRELAVAWYRANAKGVFWPAKAVRYSPRWPFDPERIIIASEQGGEVLGQQPIDPQLFTNARIYVQNDFSLPGYNPNDEHAFMAPSQIGSGVEAVFALRSDFGSAIADDAAAPSDPYVLLKYFAEAVNQWRFRIYRVEATGAGFSNFRFSGTAATTVAPPYPLRLLPSCAESFVDGEADGAPQPPAPFFRDYTSQLWAKSAGQGAVHYFYPAQPGFFTDLNTDDENDIDFENGPVCQPWLPRLPEDQGGTRNTRVPIRVAYDIRWPDEKPLLIAGETLLTPKRGLPDILNQAAVQVVYDDLQDGPRPPGAPPLTPSDTLAQLIDPLNPRIVSLDEIPASVATEFQSDGTEAILGNVAGTIKLPVSIRDRLRYDPLNGRLILTGIFDESGAGDPFLLLNVLSKRDRAKLQEIDGAGGSAWDAAIDELFRLSRNPQGITRICTSEPRVDADRNLICDSTRNVNDNDVLIGFQDEFPPADPGNDASAKGDGILEPFEAVGVNAALTAGFSQGRGLMTVAFNNNQALAPLPISLEVIEVGCLASDATTPPLLAPFQGQLNVLAPENIFDEQLVLRHSGDFGGNPDALDFQWFFQPDSTGRPPELPPNPESGQLNGWIQFPVAESQGAVEISIEGANIQTLSDNWYLARYRGLPGCNNQNEWSLFAGSPGSTPLEPLAQLAEGWVKRVLNRLNPFEARVQNFAQAATNNYASMLIQLGERFEGPIALNNDPDNLNSFGLIEAYTTVMRRALQLSVDGTPPVNFGPANNAILLVASRLVDFYTLLGNEAFADAQDPTIGITTNDGTFSLAPSIFNFQNQLATLLDEEMVLLRGRDTTNGPVTARPVYNRLFWNFTTGDGEVAYALSYNIDDQNTDGVIDEFDARIQFPQGHGDAWGHYLTANKMYYDLLRHPFYSWEPRTESILVAGVPIEVDFLDERQFAETAAAKARAGAEVVDLTYRERYVADPNGQYQGYTDTNPERAWGLSEWGRRAGMGAYLDWVTVNSILPAEDTDPANVGIRKIDRTTVREIGEIGAHYQDIQGQVDEADAGLNPLGLATGVVPFDIDPSQLDRFNTTQFEQIAERAMSALQNAVNVWDFANELTNQLRRNQNTVDDLRRASAAQETDFSNQLIEIFGYPYADDIGPAGTYPAGYNGPDMYNYMLVDVPAFAETLFEDGDPNNPLSLGQIEQFTGVYRPVPNGVNFFDFTPKSGGEVKKALDGSSCNENPEKSGCALGELDSDGADSLQVEYTTINSPDIGLWFTKPESWTGQRRAPGRIQQILQDMLQARIGLRQSVLEYDRLRLEIEAQIETLEATFNVSRANFQIANDTRKTLRNLTIASAVMSNSAIAARRVGQMISDTFGGARDCVPKSLIAGLAAGGDVTSAARCSLTFAQAAAKVTAETVADGLDIAANATEASKEDVSQLAGLRTELNSANLELFNTKGEIDAFLRQEPILRNEIYARNEAIQQLVNDYHATLAEGLRAYDRLLTFRRQGAAEVQEFRFQDMAFRIFRNDALQKYRSAFEMAARYVYLAAAAYDYETNLLGSDGQAGQRFLTDIVRQRNLGQIISGEPMPGTPGLADSMAQLNLNFDVLKGQMGFNNPQVETNRFSLRRELFRIPDGPEGDALWRQKLEESRVDDLWQLQEFRQYARPFAPQSAGPQPGLVIEFTTNVNFGLNFFGWELGAGDSSYDSSQFATRIRSVGTWFGNYASLPLAETPRIYLFPTGADVLRAPSANDFRTREWQIVDQAIPIPFPVQANDLERFDWLPSADTLSGSPTEIRRYGRFPAFHFAEPFDDSQVIADSRLVGRSVWNRNWVLIIPGGTFLADPDAGLETFINGQLVPGSNSQRDGEGVDDILIFFKTYAYTGR
ncbi:MAG: hypothetical protein RQ729_01270 [Wenzhouxiangellaceae bacterium]|nr:hypothetical protein [Wenzhouxiangellaceae bacterium]